MKKRCRYFILTISIIFLTSLVGRLIYNEQTVFAKNKYMLGTELSTLGYIKNSKEPKSLYVIDQDNMNSAEKTMIATLQGLVANFSEIQIYTVSKTHPDYSIWLDDLKTTYNIKYKIVNNPWKLLNLLKKYINGYVLYNNDSGIDPSINNACSLAAIKECIAIDESIEEKVKSIGITNKVGDCRNTNESWAYENLWNLGLNHSTVIQLSPDKDIELRDYAIMTKSLVFYEDSEYDVALREKIFNAMEDDSLCLGWGPDEYINVSTASKYGVSIVAADWSYNLSVLSSLPLVEGNEKHIYEPLTEENVHYVTFIMSDGDNQQWYLGSNYSSDKWYGYPKRGEFNMGWTISPSMYYLTPNVFNLYYKSMAKGEKSDYFLVSPSGKGYMFPSKFPKEELTNNIEQLNYYMGKVKQKYVSILDDWALLNKELWDNYTSKSNIEGLFYLNYNRQDDYQGVIVWSNNKPIVSCRYLLWEDLEEEDTLIEKIYRRVDAGDTNVHNETAYSFVYVHSWSKDMSSIHRVVEALEKNPKVRVVTPETFMLHIKNNIKSY